jgi:hypothetical protein
MRRCCSRADRLEPREAGLLITPLVACITVASIVNGRIITRIPNPNLMMNLGCTDRCRLPGGGAVRPHDRQRLPAGGDAGRRFRAGAGLAQPGVRPAGRGREHLGIATALLQSLRMIGGMLGTAITGTLVSQMYGAGVQKAGGRPRRPVAQGFQRPGSAGQPTSSRCCWPS